MWVKTWKSLVACQKSRLRFVQQQQHIPNSLAARKELFRKDSKMWCNFIHGKRIRSKCQNYVRINWEQLIGRFVSPRLSPSRHFHLVFSLDGRRPGHPFPLHQLSSCSSLRRSLHRRSVSSYQFCRFCASWWIWFRVRFSSLSIVGTIVSVHTVRGRPRRRTVSGAFRGSISSFGSKMHNRSGWL